MALKKLERLDIVDCDITGEIPTDIGKCLPRLQYCNLSHNKLTGVIPTSLRYMKNLQVLKLSFNQLGGHLEMKTFSTLFRLRELSLSYNQIEGKFPTFLFTFCPNLEILLLGFNNFSGALPSKQRLGSLTLGKSWSSIQPYDSNKKKQNKFRKAINYDNVPLLGWQGKGGEGDSLKTQLYNNVLSSCNDFETGAPYILGSLSNGNSVKSFNTEKSYYEYIESRDILFMTSKQGINSTRRKKAMRKVQSTSSLQSLSQSYLMKNNESNNALSYGGDGGGTGIKSTSYMCCDGFTNKKNSEKQKDVDSENLDERLKSVCSTRGKKANNDLAVVSISSQSNNEGHKRKGRPFSADTYTANNNLFLNYNLLCDNSKDHKSKLNETKYIPFSFEEEYNKTALPTQPLPNLRIVYLSGNNFNGQLPGTFLGALRNVKKLYLNSNQLEGEIPSTIGELHRLDELVLSQNRFEGRLPLELIDLAYGQRDRRSAQNSTYHSGHVHTSFSTNREISHQGTYIRSRLQDQQYDNRQRHGRLRGNRPSTPKLLIELQDNDGLNLNRTESETDSQTLRVVSSLREYGCELIA